jgi:chemotaxis methyl-accepting protein methylase
VIGKSGHSLEHIAFEGKSANCRKYPQNFSERGNVDSVGSIPSAIAQEPLNEFITWVLESAGLPALAYRSAPIHRRLASCVRTLKAGSIPEARRLLMKYPHLHAKAIDSLMIGVTEFSRDPAVFDALQKIVRADPAMQANPIRIWSAGCSNGAELYSVAILLAEAGLLDRSTLVGTDFRGAAIREAQAGLYNEAGVRLMDASLREKYLLRTGGKWQIAESLRAHVQWRVRNLLAGCENGPWDIILWRNMAIYLKPEPAFQVWDAMIKELRPGGFLIAGKAERPPVSTGLAAIGPCIYRLRQSATEPAGF